MRVHELAKELGIPNKALIAKLQEAGFKITSHMNALPDEAVERMRDKPKRKTGKTSAAPDKVPAPKSTPPPPKKPAAKTPAAKAESPAASPETTQT